MKISAENGRQNKIHISCDGEYRFTVDAEYWFSCPYYAKNIIEDEDEAAFLQAVGSRCAFVAGLRLLSYRDHSKKELVEKLVQKKHKREYAQAAAEKLEELGYINDERFAESLAESFLERKGMSAEKIRYELLRKGVSKETVDEILQQLDFDPVIRITELLNTKFKRYLSDEKGMKKTVASLQRLGYRWSDINSALRQIEAETEDFDYV